MAWVPGQEQLTQTLIVRFVENAFFWVVLISPQKHLAVLTDIMYLESIHGGHVVYETDVPDAEDCPQVV